MTMRRICRMCVWSIGRLNMIMRWIVMIMWRIVIIRGCWILMCWWRIIVGRGRVVVRRRRIIVCRGLINQGWWMMIIRRRLVIGRRRRLITVCRWWMWIWHWLLYWWTCRRSLRGWIMVPPIASIVSTRVGVKEITEIIKADQITFRSHSIMLGIVRDPFSSI